MTGCFSEHQLSTAFQEAYSNQLLQIEGKRPIHCIDEFAAIQGRADYVLSPTEIDSSCSNLMQRISEGVNSPASAMILSIILDEKMIEQDRLKLKVGLSISTIKRGLDSLAAAELIENDRESGEICISDSFRIPSMELWAFELKMKDWKKALLQALQFQTYSNLAYVVMPVRDSDILSRIGEVYEKYNIGLIALDHENMRISIIVSPKFSPPKSRIFYLYALANFMKRLGR